MAAQAAIQILDAEITSVLKGKKTTAEAAASVESQVNKLVTQDKDQLG